MVANLDQTYADDVGKRAKRKREENTQNEELMKNYEKTNT